MPCPECHDDPRGVLVFNLYHPCERCGSEFTAGRLFDVYEKKDCLKDKPLKYSKAGLGIYYVMRKDRGELINAIVVKNKKGNFMAQDNYVYDIDRREDILSGLEGSFYLCLVPSIAVPEKIMVTE